MKLRNGWYIINYHNIDWVDNDFLSSFRLTTSPNMLEEHLKYFANYGTIVSFELGYKYFINNSINFPMLSFSFDDGYHGVSDYAKEILNIYNAPGLVSVCEDFFTHNELFWRNKLSYIHLNEGSRFLRSRLKKYGYNLSNDRLSKFTLNNFSLDIINEINCVWDKYKLDEKEIIKNLFLGSKELKILINNGWMIGNHSTNHYPISEDICIDYFVDNLSDNDIAIKKYLEYDSKFLVLPFDRISKRSQKIDDLVRKNFKNKHIVYVGNKANTNNKHNKIYRFACENESAKDLLLKMKNINK